MGITKRTSSQRSRVVGMAFLTSAASSLPARGQGTARQTRRKRRRGACVFTGCGHCMPVLLRWQRVRACVRGHCKSSRNTTRHTSFFSINKNFQTQTNRNHHSQDSCAVYHCGSECPELLQSFGNCHAPVWLHVRHCGLHTSHPSPLQNQSTRRHRFCQ